MRYELRGLRASEARLPAARDLDDIPITVIAAATPPRRACAERQQLWLEMHARFAADAAKGRFVVAEGAGHHVQRDDPELVIAEVRDLLARIGS